MNQRLIEYFQIINRHPRQKLDNCIILVIYETLSRKSELLSSSIKLNFDYF